LGGWLRQRYDGLVSEKYNNTEMYVRSTDVDRTLMSAQANLAGFYPPKASDLWNENLPWQPIPVHTTPETDDSLLAAKKPCKHYDQLLKRLFESEEFKLLEEKFKPLYDYLSVNTGETIKSLEDVEYLYSCLRIEDIHDYSLPEWTRGVYPEKLFPISALSFASRTYTPQLARLKSGPLLKEILGHFKNKTLGLLDQNYWVYSAHDTTVANMLNTLGLFKPMGYHNPSFRAAVMFELRSIDSDYHVQIFYKNTTAEPKPLDIPGCGTSCPLDKIFEIYEKVLPIDWEKECNCPSCAINGDNNILVSLAASLLLFLTCVSFVQCLKVCVKRAQVHKLKNLDIEKNQKAKNFAKFLPPGFEKVKYFQETTPLSHTVISMKY
jgi:lysosomal acid phosphatase